MLLSGKPILTATVCGLWALAAGAAEVSPTQARAHIGEKATVCGVVASARYGSGSRAQPTFLDLGRPYPDEIFVAVVFGSDRKKFGKPEKTLLGKRVCVRGQVISHFGRPEIILSDPSQLTK